MALIIFTAFFKIIGLLNTKTLVSTFCVVVPLSLILLFLIVKIIRVWLIKIKF
jgi:hypothetical protein